VATITKRGTGWFAQVRRKGYVAQYRTFPSKVQAQAWSREQESKIDTGAGPRNVRRAGSITLGEVLRRYILEITPRKRSESSERLRLSKLLREPICELRLNELTPSAFVAYRDMRLLSVKPGTLRRELSLVSHALGIAQREWGLGVMANPIKQISLPPLNNGRERRLRDGDYLALDTAFGKTRNPLVKPIVDFAIETALRRAEILALEWRHVDLARRTACRAAIVGMLE